MSNTLNHVSRNANSTSIETKNNISNNEISTSKKGLKGLVLLAFISMLTFIISVFVIYPINCTTYRNRALYVLFQAIYVSLFVNFRYNNLKQDYDYSIRYTLTCCFFLISSIVLFLKNISTNGECINKDLSDGLFYCQLIVLTLSWVGFLLSIPDLLKAMSFLITTVMAYTPYYHILITKDINRWLIDAWLPTMLVLCGFFISWLGFHGVRVILEYVDVSKEKSRYYTIPIFAEMFTMITYFMYIEKYSVIKTLFLANCFRGVFLSFLIVLASLYTIKYCNKKKEDGIEMITTIPSDAMP
jgi:hypothetical protein